MNHLKENVLKIFNHLHSNPELSWNEYETTRYIEQQLKHLGISVTRFHDMPGLVGEFGNGNLMIGLRADMDALLHEIDGKQCAYHSCGHDAHMAIIIGAAMILKDSVMLDDVKIKLIFQPAEEKAEGAIKIIEKGIVKDLDFLYGIHLRPQGEVPFEKGAPSIQNGAGQFLSGQLFGVPSHAARPHLGTNVIEMMSLFIQHLQSIRINPMIPHSVKMTQFSAGSDNQNTIPAYGEFKLDLRAQDNETIDHLRAEVDRCAKSLTTMYNCEIKLETIGHFPAAIVDKDAQDYMKMAITDILGNRGLIQSTPTPGGEDFHFYTYYHPKLKATMLGLGCDLSPGLHHPNMTFNKDSIMHGAKIMAKVVEYTVNKSLKS